MLKLIGEMQACLGGPLSRMHDVGCGVGFLMQTAQSAGIQATGNDLNAYACQVMSQRLGLRVFNESLPNVPLPDGSLDCIVMTDYIEHTYHPQADLQTAYRLLRPGGVLYIRAFHTDCYEFDRLHDSGNMLVWNYAYRFFIINPEESGCKQPL